MEIKVTTEEAEFLYNQLKGRVSTLKDLQIEEMKNLNKNMVFELEKLINELIKLVRKFKYWN